MPTSRAISNIRSHTRLTIDYAMAADVLSDSQLISHLRYKFPSESYTPIDYCVVFHSLANTQPQTFLH